MPFGFFSSRMARSINGVGGSFDHPLSLGGTQASPVSPLNCVWKSSPER
jgi:hypothetical protein